jgi:hypothetical protein
MPPPSIGMHAPLQKACPSEQKQLTGVTPSGQVPTTQLVCEGHSP